LGGAQASEPGFEHWEPSAVVVLAAGAGQRYGKLKQAQEWDGKPFLSRVVAAALSSLATSVLVVLGCQAERLASLLAEYSSPRLQQTVNRRWQEGLASSIRAGLDTVDSAVQTVVFCGADQPLLSAAEIDALLIRHAATAAPVVAPRYAGQFRSPVLFARRLFPDMAALAGDVGGRAVLDRYGGEAETIEILDPMPYEDVDTPADYLRLRRSADDGHKR